jgi:hypothetical protein
MNSSLTIATRRTGRRLASVIVAVAFASLTLPSLVLAGAPVRTSDVAHATDPGPITVGGATLDFHVLFSTLVGARGGMTYSGPLGELFGIDGFAEMHDGHLTGEFFLIGEDSQPAGWALYDLVFTTSGAVETTERITRDGNVRTVSVFTQQPATVTGTVTMPDGTVFSVTDAAADRLTMDLRSNDPRGIILDGSETFIEATWTVGDMPVTFRANVTELDSAGVVFLSTATDPEIIGLARPQFTEEDRLHQAFELLRTDRSVAGSAVVDLAVATLGSSVAFEETDFSRSRVITDEIIVSGTLDLTLDGTLHELSFADASITATRFAWHGLQYPNAEDGGGEG